MRVLAVLVLVVLVARCGGESGKGTSTKPSEESPAAKKEAAGERAAAAREKMVEAPAPIDLSGNGQTATEPFRLESGLAIARMTYQGESNFIVGLLGGNGARAGNSLANVIGSFQGSQAVQARAGEYLLDVQASGPWMITIEQPRPNTAPRTTSFNGVGKVATDFFQLSEGLNRVELTHQGSSNFIVKLLDKNGASVGMGLVNEIGPFEGSKAVQIPKDDIYLLQVEADGPWAIQFK